MPQTLLKTSLRLRSALIRVAKAVTFIVLLSLTPSTYAVDSGVNEELLLFKASIVDSYQNSQWKILHENDLLDRPEFLSAALKGIESYLQSIKTRDEELFFAFDDDLLVRFATETVYYGLNDLAAFRSAISDQPMEMALFAIAGRPALVGFYSEEFELYFAFLFRRTE